MNLMKALLPDVAPLRSLAPLCLALLLMAAASPTSSQVFRYREQTGDDIADFSWRADQEENGTTVTVTQSQGAEVFSSINTNEGKTLSWRYVKEPSTDVRAERKDDSLHLTGQFAGKPIDKHLPIDGRPWYQPLSFSLHKMVLRDQPTVSFWTIRPDTLEVLAMQAEKSGSDLLQSGAGTPQQADRVIIRLDGPRALLWQAEYWFRQGDHLFLQYRGTHDPPGTAETRICLLTP